jgi:DNA-binding response OmpR family regulator
VPDRLFTAYRIERGVDLAKVLIVDDDRTTTKLLQTLLELDGFEISVAPRGADVIPMAEEIQPDLFLMDYHLSDTEGVVVLRELRAMARFARTPVVVASGLDVEDEVMAAGANVFLTKPFEPSDLPGLFNQLIAG